MHLQNFNLYRIANETIAMESGTFGNINFAIKNPLSIMLNDLGSKIVTSTSNLELAFYKLADIFSLKKEENVLEEKLQVFKYIDIMKLKVSVPEGFNGNFLEYSNLLKESVLTIKTLDDDLNEYKKLISEFISNPKLMTRDAVNMDYAKSKINTIANLNKNIGKLFNGNGNSTSRELGKLFRNNNEINDTLRTSYLIKDVIGIKNLKIDKIKNNVSDIIELVNVLIKNINSNDEFQVSASIVVLMGNYTEMIAKLVEFYAITHFRLLAYLNSLDNTIATIKNLK